MTDLQNLTHSVKVWCSLLLALSKRAASGLLQVLIIRVSTYYLKAFHAHIIGIQGTYVHRTIGASVLRPYMGKNGNTIMNVHTYSHFSISNMPAMKRSPNTQSASLSMDIQWPDTTRETAWGACKAISICVLTLLISINHPPSFSRLGPQRV